MGYDLHITRADDWVENERQQIEASEWHALIESDPELRLAGGYHGPHFAFWDGHPEDDEAWLDWHDGNIETKNPDDRLVRKMIEIAGRLGAKVQGDDGELYTEESLDAPPPKRPLFWTMPFISFILSLVALPCLIFLIRLDSYVREQYPLGTPMPTKWILVFTCLAIVTVPGWLVGGIFAICSFILKQERLVFAWLALVLLGIGACIFIFWR
jgi:hypothetical protein